MPLSFLPFDSPQRPSLTQLTTFWARAHTRDTSDQDSDSDSAAGCDAPGARSSAEAQHERSVLEKLDRFMRRDDESGAPGNGAGGEGEQPQRSGHVLAAPASDDDDDWVTVKP
jgi:hypothetical protein